MTAHAGMDAQDLELLRTSVRQFLASEVEPFYEEWETAEIWPRELWNKFGEQGFLCVDVPPEYGGLGLPFEASCAILEEIGRAGYAALAAGVCVHSDITAPYVSDLGSEAQKQYWLPKMVSGEAIGAIGMSEPAAGSDLQGILTTAIRDGDDYLVNGQKTFITNGQHCDLTILAAKTDATKKAKGISLFALDMSLPGVKKGTNLKKIGMHSGDTSELFFTDVRTPAGSLLGKEGSGFAGMMDKLRRERLTLSVAAHGAAEGMLQQTVEYVLQRKAFGSPIAKFQNTRFKLAEMKTEIEMSRALMEKCMREMRDGTLTPAQASMFKLAATEMQGRVADQCLQLFGGYGYMREYPIARAYVDARVQRIYGGTSEIMKELIARELVGR